MVAADLTKEAAVKKLFAAALKKFGHVDTLIANAGQWEKRDVPLHEMSLAQWRGTQDGVLTSTFLCTREFFRRVAKQKTGNAVLIASTAAVFGEAGHADYASAKAAMAYGLTRTLKNEISRDEMEQGYISNWKKLFATRLKTGRIVQRFFGQNRLTGIFISLMKRLPGLSTWIIRKTHGQPF